MNAPPVPRAAVFACPGRPRPLARRLAIHNRALRRARDFFEIEGYNEIPVPALAPVGTACEAVASAVAVDHCGDLAFVRQSGQLTLDGMVARGFPAVWCEAESVRREWKRDERHLTGFKLLEAVRRDLDLDGLCDQMVRLLRHVAAGLGADLLGGRHVTRLHRLAQLEIPRVTYREALEVLNARGWSMPFGEDLHRDAEATLTRWAGHAPLLVTHLPAALKPFNLRRDPDDAEVTLSAELILPWAGETADGGVLETDAGAMRARLHASPLFQQLQQQAADFAVQQAAAGAGRGEAGAAGDRHREAVRRAFEDYLAPFAEAAPPRAGFALGFARLLQYVQGLDSIRDAVILPLDRTSFAPGAGTAGADAGGGAVTA